MIPKFMLKGASIPQIFDYAEHKRPQRIREIALEAARKVEPLIRKAMEEAAERGREIAREMAKGARSPQG